MSERPPLFGAGELVELLRTVGERLAARDEQFSAYVIGGFAIALELRDRRLTEDIDGHFSNYSAVRAEADALADERGIPRGWLNSKAFAFMSFDPADDVGATEIMIGPVRVRIASPRYLLAMKIAAGRPKDRGDLVALIRAMGIENPQDIVDIAFDVFGEESTTLVDSRESVYFQAAELIRQVSAERGVAQT